MYVVYCVDKPNHLPVRLANRDAHLAHARANLDRILIAGPMLTEDGTGMVGSMFVFTMDSREEVERHMAEDPYVKAGLFESVLIRPFKKVLP
ncbi:MAG: YciI family protein [Rhodospirillales bacterium]|nr:YciI family protein [Rhodospirillales bacterium]